MQCYKLFVTTVGPRCDILPKQGEKEDTLVRILNEMRLNINTWSTIFYSISFITEGFAPVLVVVFNKVHLKTTGSNKYGDHEVMSLNKH